MTARLESLAHRKEELVARSELCRRHLQRELRGVRESLRWKRALVAVAAAPSTRRVAFALALSWVGLARAARMVALAGRIVLYAKLASSVISFASRSPARRPAADERLLS